MTAPDHDAARWGATPPGYEATNTAEPAANQMSATPKLAADDLRDRIAEALRQAFHHWITAEWICCEPLAKGHKLCKKGHATRRMVRALLADDPEEWPPKSPIIDAVMAVVQPSQLPASPTAGSNDLRQQLADAVQGQVQTILRKRGDRHPTLAAMTDVYAAVVQPMLDAKDAEIKRLHVEVSRFQRAWEDAMADGDQQAVQRLSLRNQLNQERQRADKLSEILTSVWLYVSWRYVTKQLTAEQKELWADVIESTGDPNDRATVDRWWRDDQ